MQVPLIGNEDTSKALQEWESQQIKPQELPQHVQKNMEKAQAAVAQRQALEEAVTPCKPANEELLAAYMAYIQLEQVLSAAHQTCINTWRCTGQSQRFLWLYVPSLVLPHTAAMHLMTITYLCKAEAKDRSVRTLCRSRSSRLVS